MSWRIAFFLLLILSVVINCSRGPLQSSGPEIARTMQPEDISGFHSPINIKLGWVPYENQKLVQTGKNEWKVVQRDEKDKKGKVPVLYVQHGGSEEALLLDMNIDNQLLGKLIKHSAITQEPIARPFGEFFERASCDKCHPADVEADFD
ncbi:MAG: hypothetical protein HKN45_07835 [Flavobacteriales bacterium]|nr:hypothetical protein [Flavobacteriales bacterium]